MNDIEMQRRAFVGIIEALLDARGRIDSGWITSSNHQNTVAHVIMANALEEATDKFNRESARYYGAERIPGGLMTSFNLVHPLAKSLDDHCVPDDYFNIVLDWAIAGEGRTKAEVLELFDKTVHKLILIKEHFVSGHSEGIMARFARLGKVTGLW